jgi:hypothetical protein
VCDIRMRRSPPRLEIEWLQRAQGYSDLVSMHSEVPGNGMHLCSDYARHSSAQYGLLEIPGKDYEAENDIRGLAWVGVSEETGRGEHCVARVEPLGV